MLPQQLTNLQQLLSLLPVDSKGSRDALFRPSSIDRVIACPGSVWLSARVPKIKGPSTQAQLEGSCFHKVVEEALRGTRQPDEWTDRMVAISSMEGLFADEEMVESAQWFIDLVNERRVEGSELFVEHKLSLAVLNPADPLLAENRGTGDAIILNRRDQIITIADAKYGKGVMVPGDAPQLLDYAIMTMLTFTDTPWKKIETVVGQPRARYEHEREKSVMFEPGDLLMDFLPKLVGAMEAALNPNAPLNPTPKGCMWCPAKYVCPAVTDLALNLSQESFTQDQRVSNAKSMLGPIPEVMHEREITDGAAALKTPDTPTVYLPDPLDLSPQELSLLMDRFEVYDGFKTAVKQRVAQIIQAGGTVPGWVVESKSGHRKFVEPDTIPEAFVNLGATQKDLQSLLRTLGLNISEMYTEPKLKSPAQMEKKVKAPLRPLIDLLTFKPLGEPTLMPSSSFKGSTNQEHTNRLGPIGEG